MCGSVGRGQLPFDTILRGVNVMELQNCLLVCHNSSLEAVDIYILLAFGKSLVIIFFTDKKKKKTSKLQY